MQYTFSFQIFEVGELDLDKDLDFNTRFASSWQGS